MMGIRSAFPRGTAYFAASRVSGPFASNTANYPKGTSIGLRVYALLFAAYIGSGPIYWLPFVEVGALGLLKSALFAFVVLVPLCFKTNFSRLYFPGGVKAFFLLGLFLALSIPGMIFGDPDASIYRLQNTLQILLTVYATGFIIKKKLIENVLVTAVKIFSAFVVLSFLLILLAPNYVNPINETLTVASTGLGGSRTGWGPSVAMYFPWVFGGYAIGGVASWLIGFAIAANVILIAGRTGMLAAFVPFLVWGFVNKNFRSFLTVSVASAVVVLYAMENLDAMRLGVGGIGSRSALDDLSTGRIEQYAAALSAIMENPLFGYGTGELWYAGQSWYVHNTILRLAVEGGVPYALVVVGMFVLALRRGWRQAKRGSRLGFAALLTILSGIVTSFFEPGAMFGPFHMAAFWWVCFSVCVTLPEEGTVEDVEA